MATQFTKLKFEIGIAFCGSLAALLLSFGLMAHAQEKSDYKWSWDVQDRVEYNNSNIGASSNYDFFSERVRLGANLESSEKIGAYTQIEYRGTFGAAQGYDPSSAPFNRLNARGIRYGYIYAPVSYGQLKVGLVPLNDELHQTMFSADWDFNVGGLTYTIDNSDFTLRASYLRLVDGSSITTSSTANVADQDESMGVLDVDYVALPQMKFGLHYYTLFGKLCTNSATCKTTPSTATAADFSPRQQNWVAATFKWDNEIVPFDAFVVYNKGNENNVTNEGYLAFLEGKKNVYGYEVSGLATYSSGGTASASATGQGTGYQTVEGLEGTAGYWGYANIFTANGASDVNGYIVNPSNKGFGLQSYQIKVSKVINAKWSAQIYDAFLKSSKAMTDSTGAAYGTGLGNELGAAFIYSFDKYLHCEFGYANATLGDAAQALYQKTTTTNIQEVFTRFQLEI